MGQAGRSFAVGLVLAAFVVGEAALTQEVITDIPVRQRPRPDVGQLGIIAGSWEIKPAIILGTEYNDNIFATPDDKVDDFIFTIEPEIVAQSDWGRHSLGFVASGKIFRYVDNSSENVEDANVAGTGRLDITRDAYLTGGLGFSKDHEERGDPDDVQGLEPTVFFVYGGDAGYFQRFGRFSTLLSADARKLNYNDTPGLLGTINNDDRDRFEYNFEGRGEYEIQPGYNAFLALGGNLRRYDDKPDDLGFFRDSSGFRVTAGARLDLTGLIFGDIGAGYLRQSHEDDRFDTTNSGFGSINLTWLATALTTVKFGLNTGLVETTQADSSIRLNTRASVGVDHELLRNLILNGRFTYNRDDFQGTDRKDNRFDVEVSASYLMNQYLYWDVGYRYTRRDSNDPLEDYSRNLAFVRARLQY